MRERVYRERGKEREERERETERERYVAAERERGGGVSELLLEGRKDL